MINRKKYRKCLICRSKLIYGKDVHVLEGVDEENYATSYKRKFAYIVLCTDCGKFLLEHRHKLHEEKRKKDEITTSL